MESPVIGLNIGTRNNFIQNEVNGFITDLDGLKESIERSYNFQGYGDLRKCAKETAKKYKNEYVISSQIEMYKKIVSTHYCLIFFCIRQIF